MKKIYICLVNIWRFYYEGFCSMTIGKTLWLIILVKLFIMFAIFRLFFFPDVLKRDYSTDEERAEAVREQLVRPRIRNIISENINKNFHIEMWNLTEFTYE